MDEPVCELCGEAPAEVRAKYVGMCGDCFGREVSDALGATGIDKYCCRPLFVGGELSAVCMWPCGTEYDHAELLADALARRAANKLGE